MVNTPILVGSATTARLGLIWLAASPNGVVAVEFGVPEDRFKSLVHELTHSEALNGQGRLQSVVRQLREYVEGRRHHLDFTIDWSVIRSQFQRQALQAVLTIPYGQTRTYAQIAARIGFPLAARAVGRANAANPMPLVIPCHRVVGSDGTLPGYGGVGGLHTKAWLLKMEASHA